MTLSYFRSSGLTGFPSPAEEWDERALNMHDLLVSHAESTFFVRVRGEGMGGAGIRDTDILVVDRALLPDHGDIVIAVYEGRLTVKRFLLAQQHARLRSEPLHRPPILLEGVPFKIWGVVTAGVHLYHPSLLSKLFCSSGKAR
jgi:DNA polymerase V